MQKNLSIETDLWEKGYDYVIGVDEVGRGCLAGPICAGAVVWKRDVLLSLIEDEKNNIHKIKDSKKILESRRNELSLFIKTECLAFSVCEISSSEIDRDGIQKANKKVMIHAVQEVINKIEDDKKSIILTDYLDIKLSNTEVLPVLYGDSASISISSASIIAKVYRDTLMKTSVHKRFPQFGFDRHVGYGTTLHINMIREHGICDEHRKTFLKNILGQ